MTLVMRIRQGVWVDVDFLSIVWDGEVGLGGCIYRVQDFDCLEAGSKGWFQISEKIGAGEAPRTWERMDPAR